jgi:hypothetical protein
VEAIGNRQRLELAMGWDIAVRLEGFLDFRARFGSHFGGHRRSPRDGDALLAGGIADRTGASLVDGSVASAAFCVAAGELCSMRL